MSIAVRYTEVAFSRTLWMILFFFFQAEDGIRDVAVTGVQTCALPIYRYHGHHVGDINREYYRSKQEEQEWKTKRDPIKNFAGWMIQQRVADEMALEEIRKNVRVEMKAAVEFAIAAPYPKPEEADENVYA